MDFKFQDLKNEVLSPGNIFWKKNSGSTVLISKKGDVLNFALIEKLENAQQVLVMEDGIDIQHLHEMHFIYLKYCDEIFMREKIRWRDQLIEMLRKNFVEDQKTKLEMNMLAWKFFSKFSNEEASQFVERDSDLFRRNLSVASSYTFCAFLLGYYEPSFLSKIFSSTLKHLMEIGQNIHILSLKEKLEYLRMQESFDDEDFKSVAEVASEAVISKTVIFERYDGSGMRKINSREMNDLEIVLVVLNQAYSFNELSEVNALSEIENGSLKFEKRILGLLKKVLNKKSDEFMISA